MFRDFLFNSLTRVIICVVIILILLSLSFSFVFSFISKKQNYKVIRVINYFVKAVYFLVLLTLIQWVSETKIFFDIDILGYLLYSASIPALLSIYLFVKRHNFIYLFDFVCFIFLMPFVAHFNMDAFSMIVSITTLLVMTRHLYTLISRLLGNKYKYDYFLAKASLDSINEGLAIQGKKYDEFQNDKFKYIMNELHINNYDSPQNIWNIIESSTELNKYKYENDSYLINIKQHYYLIRKYKQTNYCELVTYCVDEQFEAKKQIELNYKFEEKQNKKLKEYISHIKTIEKENLIKQTKSKFHNLLGQRATIIQYILNDYYKSDELDLKFLKEKLLNTLKEINDDVQIDFKDELQILVDTFKVAGFNIIINGDINKYKEIQNKYFIDILRECATNSLSHAKANSLNVNIIKIDHKTVIAIKDDVMVISDHIEESTGIASIKYNVRMLNGTITINYKDGFNINISI